MRETVSVRREMLSLRTLSQILKCFRKFPEHKLSLLPLHRHDLAHKDRFMYSTFRWGFDYAVANDIIALRNLVYPIRPLEKPSMLKLA